MSKNAFTLEPFEKRRKRHEDDCDERYAKGKHFLLSTSHREGCFMCEHSTGLDPEAFILYDGIEYRDAIGRKRKNGQMWYRFRCNDADCHAKLLVRWDALARSITLGWVQDV